ncbi:MAG: Ldh family oxidoreductase [Devosia sp.]
MTSQRVFRADEMGPFIAALFAAAGLSLPAAQRVSDALVEADLSGRGSHGILQADGYLARLMAGAMSTSDTPRIVSDRGGAIVLDAEGIEGHLAAEEAIHIGVTRAREQGVATVAVRHGFHFGVAGRYVRLAAEQGCVAIVMCNTKPVMAAPGGAERLVGTNPLAIGIPTLDEPFVLDMATSTGSYGRIRQARAAGQAIPPDWALDADGEPTTDAAAAMEGFLLPMAGAKGFGLSLAIDLLSGLLASGGWGAGLGSIDDDVSKPSNGAYLFIVIDIAHFRPPEEFREQSSAAGKRVRSSRRAQGTQRLYTPGERSAETLANNDGTLSLAPSVVSALIVRAAALGVTVPDFLQG